MNIKENLMNVKERGGGESGDASGVLTGEELPVEVEKNIKEFWAVVKRSKRKKEQVEKQSVNLKKEKKET